MCFYNLLGKCAVFQFDLSNFKSHIYGSQLYRHVKYIYIRKTRNAEKELFLFPFFITACSLP
jgi:hypothetical protein